MSVRSLVALLALSLLAAACSEPDSPPAAALVGQADVARVKLRAFVETQAIDAEIARVEAEAAAADSLRQQAYAPVLERLRQDRRRLQVRVDSLAPMPPAAFDSATVGVARGLARLRAAVARARFDAATDPATLQAATAARLARFDARLAAARTAATADTTGRRIALLDSLAADRGRLDARLAAFADTTAPAFTRLRQTTVRDALRLEGRLARIAPDSTGR
ncbi:MAG TPA: hypothetical protein VF594_03910 [Rubricoccaceae bacterium]